VVVVGVFLLQAEEGIRDWSVTGVQTCALPIWHPVPLRAAALGCGRYIPLYIATTAKRRCAQWDRMPIVVDEKIEGESAVFPLVQIGRASGREQDEEAVQSRSRRGRGVREDAM